MAKPRLKVFRTPAGFDDAYVAAPSQKAALKAWGSDADLFARGIAEQVTDAALMKAPLAAPGEVIRVRRTGGDDTPAERRRAKPAAPAPASPAKPRPKRPSRATLDKAEAAIAAAEKAQKDALADLDARRRALDEERRQVEKSHRATRVKLDKARIRARDSYDAALAAWDAD